MTEQYRKAEALEYTIQHDNRVMSEGKEREMGEKEEERRESPEMDEMRDRCCIIARGLSLSR